MYVNRGCKRIVRANTCALHSICVLGLHRSRPHPCAAQATSEAIHALLSHYPDLRCVLRLIGCAVGGAATCDMLPGPFMLPSGASNVLFIAVFLALSWRSSSAGGIAEFQGRTAGIFAAFCTAAPSANSLPACFGDLWGAARGAGQICRAGE